MRTVQLPSYLVGFVRMKGVSLAEVHRRIVRRGLAVNASTVTRWFTARPDRIVPSPGELRIICEILGIDEAGQAHALALAAADLNASLAEAA